MNDIRRRFVIIMLGAILAAALFTRILTFWQPHWSGDQEIYTALAMKLSHGGLDQYNLRGIDVKRYEVAILGGQVKLAMGEVVPAKEGDMGNLLKIRYQYGLKHYDQPLYFIAPAFPYVLMLSNHIFCPEKRYMGSSTAVGDLLYRIRPKEYFRVQFYSAIVPLSFGILLVALTFMLGKILFSDRIGLYAAFCLTVNPVSILSSQRIWTDDMCASFITLSVIMLVLYMRDKNNLYPVLSGIFIGIATLTRQSAIIMMPVLLFFNTLSIINGKRSQKSYINATFSRSNVVIITGFLAVTAFWFLKVYDTYHTFFFMPDMKSALDTDKTNWWELTRNRPSPLVLLFVGLPIIWPFFLSVYAMTKAMLNDLIGSLRGLRFSPLSFVFVWALLFIVFVGYMGDMAKEYRYMIPAYPAFCIIAALGLQKLRCVIAKYLPKNHIILPDIIVASLVLIAGIWSGMIGVDSAVQNVSEIMKPF